VQFAIAGYIFFDRHWREVHHHLWIPMSTKILSSFLVGMQCDFPFCKNNPFLDHLFHRDCALS
jgi:hypothetical protein